MSYISKINVRGTEHDIQAKSYDGILPIVNGGTGASTASAARENLGFTDSDWVDIDEDCIFARKKNGFVNLVGMSEGLTYIGDMEQVLGQIPEGYRPLMPPSFSGLLFVPINGAEEYAHCSSIISIDIDGIITCIDPLGSKWSFNVTYPVAD